MSKARATMAARLWKFEDRLEAEVRRAVARFYQATGFLVVKMEPCNWESDGPSTIYIETKPDPEDRG